MTRPITPEYLKEIEARASEDLEYEPGLASAQAVPWLVARIRELEALAPIREQESRLAWSDVARIERERDAAIARADAAEARWDTHLDRERAYVEAHGMGAGELAEAEHALCVEARVEAAALKAENARLREVVEAARKIPPYICPRLNGALRLLDIHQETKP